MFGGNGLELPIKGDMIEQKLVIPSDCSEVCKQVRGPSG